MPSQELKLIIRLFYDNLKYFCYVLLNKIVTRLWVLGSQGFGRQ
jgi:hypothetical protein